MSTPPRERAAAIRPFLKWAGGKRLLLDQIRPHLPKTFGHYYEPFVGGAAMFFALGARHATLSDNNRRLIRTYRALRDHPDALIERLRGYKNEKGDYLSERKKDIDAECDDVLVAAWLIYLNKTAFNGLYRVNSKNGFNVPFGNYKRPNICDEKRLRACSERLRDVALRWCDFEQTVAGAREGDLVYFDPPYIPLSTTSNFASYTKQGFGMEDHERLRDVALRLKARGVHVLVSNSSAKAVHDLYKRPFKRVKIQAPRRINAQGDGRGDVTELLIV